MTYKDAAQRALATFVQAFLGVLVESGLLGNTGDLSTLKKASVAGLIALITYLHRAVQAWSEKR